MKHSSICKSSRLPKLGTLFILGTGIVRACGPDFPNRYLDLPAQTILAAPEGFFAVEIERLAPAPEASRSIQESKDDTREIDELRTALTKRGELTVRVEQLTSAYGCYREQQRKSAAGEAKVKLGEVPSGLPPEFAHYLAGAKAWYENDVETARAEWKAVLSLPDSERHYRATWAAYMLGRSAGDEFPPDEAIKWFAETRELASRGFADSINLAGASYGIEARWAMALQDHGRAICLYLDQYATGDESANASLRIAAAAAAGSGELQKREIAREPRARRVLTVWFLARFVSGYDSEVNPRPLREWTGALVKEQVRDIEHADRLAWLAYEAGDFELAKTWAGLALESSAETHWIRAKLALLDNKLCEGAKELSRAATSPDIAPLYRSTVLGELGRVQLALDHREAALRAWLDGAHWEDAAYVAERLLTIDELKMFMANYCPADFALYEPYWGETITPKTVGLSQSARTDSRDPESPSLRRELSELLARRLVRAGRIAEAKTYFCEKNRAMLAIYATDVQAGFDTMLRPRKRAEAFWRAARLVREEGMTLMGAELEPDFAIWGGSFSSYGAAEDRIKLPAGPFSITKEEQERLSNVAIPAKRFSYRYRAADLAWWAASLLPNENDETATVLETAGGWLKSRDPVEANKFYQALVIRCGQTKRGKAASERHWFPSDL
jgi:tetratricopeptide (TPR) repeat protein